LKGANKLFYIIASQTKATTNNYEKKIRVLALAM